MAIVLARSNHLFCYSSHFFIWILSPIKMQMWQRLKINSDKRILFFQSFSSVMVLKGSYINDCKIIFVNIWQNIFLISKALKYFLFPISIKHKKYFGFLMRDEERILNPKTTTTCHNKYKEELWLGARYINMLCKGRLKKVFLSLWCLRTFQVVRRLLPLDIS